MRTHTRPRRMTWLGTSFAATSLLIASCSGDFGGEAAAGDDEGGGVETAQDCGEPELSPPPEIDCEVLDGDDLAEHTIKFGIGLAEDSPQGRAVQYFGDYLSECTDGRLTVDLFPDSQVGDDLEMMSGLRSGTLEMTYPSTSPAVSFVPELGVFDLPFLVPDTDAADRIFDSEVGDEMLAEFEGSGMLALAWGENGFRQVTNNDGPIESPEDVQGLDVRVMENEIQVTIWEQLGANPTTMAFGEVFSALEQGVVSGQENPWVTNYTSNFWEVQDYGSETRHVYTPFLFMIGEEFYNGLDPAYQDLIQEASDATSEYQRQVAREMDSWARDQFEASGAEVNVLDEDQLDAFREATAPVYDRWAPQIGEELIDEVRSVAEGE